VKKGDLQFITEPEPYQVKVDQAKAAGLVEESPERLFLEQPLHYHLNSC